MKRIFALMAALTVAAPANAFIVVPEADRSPLRTRTDVMLRFCYELHSSGEMNSETWNKTCVPTGNQSSVMWTNAEKCDDFEGCAKVDMLVTNTFLGDAFYNDRVDAANRPIFEAKPKPLTYLESATLNCQKPPSDITIEGVDWEKNLNKVHYVYDTKQLQREVCNEAYDVDNSTTLLDAAVTWACAQKHPHNGDDRNKCVDELRYNRERRQWK